MTANQTIDNVENISIAFRNYAATYHQTHGPWGYKISKKEQKKFRKM